MHEAQHHAIGELLTVVAKSRVGEVILVAHGKGKGGKKSGGKKGGY